MEEVYQREQSQDDKELDFLSSHFNPGKALLSSLDDKHLPCPEVDHDTLFMCIT